jgi:hypothetical protein
MLLAERGYDAHWISEFAIKRRAGPLRVRETLRR